MKHALFNLTLVFFVLLGHAQSSPYFGTQAKGLDNLNKRVLPSDTITFDEYTTGDIITDQYVDYGILFEGFGDNGAPVVHDYGDPQFFGPTLRSENWFDEMKLTFVDPMNPSDNQLARKIEFDNVVDYAGETDFISVDVYNAQDELIDHYLSDGPERVVLEYEMPEVAYIVLDDSAITAYVIDNILIDFEGASSVLERFEFEFDIFPNPSSGLFRITSEKSIDQLQVHDSSGRLIEQISPRKSEYFLELIEPGMYSVSFHSQGRMTTKTVVVIH
ncbi:MAG: T9SS type A sorting domain-containing protein [Flavobacteriales bacterium]|nr:T9SS type A sorting domain-containing protein [Flavobacteriales bacterium]